MVSYTATYTRACSTVYHIYSTTCPFLVLRAHVDVWEKKVLGSNDPNPNPYETLGDIDACTSRWFIRRESHLPRQESIQDATRKYSVSCYAL